MASDSKQLRFLLNRPRRRTMDATSRVERSTDRRAMYELTKSTRDEQSFGDLRQTPAAYFAEAEDSLENRELALDFVRIFDLT